MLCENDCKNFVNKKLNTLNCNFRTIKFKNLNVFTTCSFYTIVIYMNIHYVTFPEEIKKQLYLFQHKCFSIVQSTHENGSMKFL